MSVTTVTGTLTDGAGTLLTGTWVTAAFFGDQFSNVAGATFPLFAGPVKAVNGTFSIPVTDNLTVAPAGSQWKFQFCPPANNPQCFSFVTTVSGPAQDITPIINIPPLEFRPMTVSAAYSSSQVDNPRIGSIYWDLMQQLLCVYNGAAWVPVGTGVGGAQRPMDESLVVANSGTDWILQTAPIFGFPIQVFRNGLKLAMPADYTVVAQTVTFTSGYLAGDILGASYWRFF